MASYDGYYSRRYSAPVSGCYIVLYPGRQRYLPLLNVAAHTSIVSSTQRTVLTQTFVNPQPLDHAPEVRYSFPLYEEVTVVGFVCTICDRRVAGVVKERQEAKQEYAKAKASGLHTALFEQSASSADIFTIFVGNVPTGEVVVVELTYLGELKHDAEVDGLRLTIPTSIAPRYGQDQSFDFSPSTAENYKKGGFSVTVDIETPDGCSISSVQSPSHPVAVNIGTLSSGDSSANPSFQKAHITLVQPNAQLEGDFVLQVVAAGLSEPSAVLEKHPSIPHQQALALTLVPKFNLPVERPEVVFICDRSGSMHSGRKMTNLRSALYTFLKSIPIGCKFNIYSFGTEFEYLWPKSQTYSQEMLDLAVKYVNSFTANFGGTDPGPALARAFKQRWEDMNLEVFFLTDGQVSGQQSIFDRINKAAIETKGAVRVFTIGVGNDVSHALIGGAARAGNGFAQAVGEDEKMDKKVVRMLKAALSPHIRDYTLEIKYDPSDGADIMGCIADAVKLDIEEPPIVTGGGAVPKETVSLFDPKADDKGDGVPDADPQSKFDHLPTIPVPKYLQAPFDTPSLFPFNRTAVYVSMPASPPDRMPHSVILKATSTYGPLELEIPITKFNENTKSTRSQTTIHQLAARKAVQDLEEGRGWLIHARGSNGKLLSEMYPGRFSDIVEREAVRLGVLYQVSGKYCSFVAVEDGKADVAAEIGKAGSPAFYSPGGPRLIASAFPDTPTKGRIPQPVIGAMGAPKSSRIWSIFGSMFNGKESSSRQAEPSKKKGSFSFFGGGRGTSEANGTVRGSPLEIITALQKFDGSWSWDANLEEVLGVKRGQAKSKVKIPDGAKADQSQGAREDLLATLCTVVFLRRKLAEQMEVWNMMVDKAVDWLKSQTGLEMDVLEGAVNGLF